MAEKTHYAYRVDPQWVDFTQRASVAALTNAVLSVAGVDAQRKGFGTDTLNKENFSWVLLRMAVEFDHRPEQYTDFSITTWVSDYGRMMSTRNFTVQDNEGAPVENMQMIFEVGGKGHSCGIYSFDDDHIHRLGMAAPVSRIMVRQPNNKGNSGSPTNGMPPTSSMGCGTWGGNIVSENITLKHYMNTTWVARPIAMDMPSNEELFGQFFKEGMDIE